MELSNRYKSVQGYNGVCIAELNVSVMYLWRDTVELIRTKLIANPSIKIANVALSPNYTGLQGNAA